MTDADADADDDALTLLTLLTRAEREVLALLAEGLSNQAVSERLGIRPKSVERRLTTLFAKLGLKDEVVHNRRVMAVLAYWRSTDQPLNPSAHDHPKRRGDCRHRPS